MAELIIPKRLVKTLKRRLKLAGRREIGGILLAEQMSPGSFKLVECSLESQVGTRSQFRRSEAEHTMALNAFLERNGNEYGRFNYLGEWHSHPSFSVNPSQQDRMTMEGIVNDNADLPFAVLLIVKLSGWFGLKASATVFEHSKEPYSMEIKMTKKSINSGADYG